MVETTRLILKPHQLSDMDDLHNILSDEKTMSFWPSPFTKVQTDMWIRRQIENRNKYGFGRYIVILKENMKVIGDCGIMRTEVDGKLENDLGYIIHSSYWGYGFGHEAAQKSMEDGINKNSLTRICANMAYNHYQSIKLAEKLNMVKEKEFVNKKNREILTFLYTYEI